MFKAGTFCYPSPHKFQVQFFVLTLLLKAPAYVSSLSPLISLLLPHSFGHIQQAHGLFICCSFEHTSIWHLHSSTSALLSFHSWVNPVQTCSVEAQAHISGSILFQALSVFTAPMVIWHVSLLLYKHRYSRCYDVNVWRTCSWLADLYTNVKEWKLECAAQLWRDQVACEMLWLMPQLLGF